MSKKILILLQILFTITCSSRGMDRGKLPDVSDKNIIIDDSEIKKYSSLKPQLKMPFRVGIYLVNPEGTYYRINGEDKSHLLSIENELKETAADTLRSGLPPSLGLKAHCPPSRFLLCKKTRRR
jgi:hypothetical protein